jgi:16S rRNA (uracil1498-N3)-methyltransferase
MDLFFVKNFQPRDRTILLSPEEGRHAVKVLRKRIGDLIDLTDGAGHYLQGTILKDSPQELMLELTRVEMRSRADENQIEVALPVIRPNRMDWAVEKLTELGVSKIAPITCAYSTARQIKKAHLRKIMISAIKQSRQFYLPEISPVTGFAEWIKDAVSKEGTKYIAHQEVANKEIKRPYPAGMIYLAVGPEGGFHPEEINLAFSSGFEILYLGDTILRTETAAVVGVTKIKTLFSGTLVGEE